jgi:ATP-dependent DNA ligase
MIHPILPMLATAAEPFDSYDYFFEVKWDGVRALAAVESGDYRLWGRELADYGDRYPELDALRRLPSGTVVDGELVVFQDGRPDLNALLRRHQLIHPARIRHASRQTPVRYVLFDILYHQGKSLLREPFHRRRCALVDVLTSQEMPELVFSEGIAGLGQDFFEQVVAHGHEGIMAKHQRSRYCPGKRSSAWRKIKPVQVLPCAIIGFTPSRAGFHSLLLATMREGEFRYVGQVSSGFSSADRADLSRQLLQRLRSQPVVACAHKARWVEPDLFCRIRFLQWTSAVRPQANRSPIVREDIACNLVTPLRAARAAGAVVFTARPSPPGMVSFWRLIPMIANPKACLAPNALQRRFLALVPRLEGHARICFRHIPCAHQRADKVAETIALPGSGSGACRNAAR